jgi:GNAT superfamily N-acetyltransferase
MLARFFSCLPAFLIQSSAFDIGRSTLSIGRLPVQFTIRRATVADADIIASHRARMFRDMGDIVDGEPFENLRAQTKARLTNWLESGDYVGWLAASPDAKIIAGDGVQLQTILPRPRASPPSGRTRPAVRSTSSIGPGRQGTIVNVFTEPDWRRRGLASLLIKEIITWSRHERLDRLLLHASAEGRSVYERLGFIAGNDMRFVCED